jgi:hypothetical protein
LLAAWLTVAARRSRRATAMGRCPRRRR